MYSALFCMLSSLVCNLAHIYFNVMLFSRRRNRRGLGRPCSQPRRHAVSIVLVIYGQLVSDVVFLSCFRHCSKIAHLRRTRKSLQATSSLRCLSRLATLRRQYPRLLSNTTLLSASKECLLFFCPFPLFQNPSFPSFSLLNLEKQTIGLCDLHLLRY